MEDDLKILKVEYLSYHWLDIPQIFNLWYWDQTEIKNFLNPQTEDNLKILKVEHLSNHWSDLSQILNLSSGDQTKIKNAWNEDDLQWKTTSKY